MKKIVSILAICWLAGCSSSGEGYHWSSVYRKDIRTVAVPQFKSKDYHRDVEFQLTDALVKKIEEFTPYKVAPRERADTVLEGEIVSIQTITLGLDPFTATPQEQQYSIIVNFTWKDLHTGKILVSRRDFQQAAPYYPTLGEGQYVASENSVEKLAQAIVGEMEGEW
jgi:Lipopolysaccharide-assembly